MPAQNNMMLNNNIEDAVIRDIPGEMSEDFVIENVKNKSNNGSLGTSFFKRYLSPRVLSVFCMQWSIIIHSGASSLNALKIVREQTDDKRLKKSLDMIIRKVSVGIPISEAMNNAGIFPADFVKCVEIADEYGKLEDCLTRYSKVFANRDREITLRNQSATRPFGLCVLALAIILVMLAVIYPRFIYMFEGTGIEMPVYTRAILKFSTIIRDYWIIIALVIMAVYVAFKLFSYTDSGKAFWSKISLKNFFGGRIKKKHVLSDVARSLSVMLAEGYDTSEALRVLSQTYGDEEYIRLYLGRASVSIQSGITLSHALSDAGFFPPVFTQMLSVGEEMGNVVEMLNDIADYYDEEAQRSAEKRIAILEPVIIVSMALIMFFVIMSLTSPITMLFDYVSGL